MNLNRPTLMPGKLDETDFDRLPPAEACTELGAHQVGGAQRQGRGGVLLWVALVLALVGWFLHAALA